MQQFRWILRIARGGLCLIAGIGGAWAQVESWQATGPEGGSFTGIVVNPENAQQVTAITSNPSVVYRTHDGGASWTRVGAIASSVNEFEAHDFQNLYVTTYSGYYSSSDGGDQWEFHRIPAAAGGSHSIYTFCSHPTDNNTLYAATLTYLWEGD